MTDSILRSYQWYSTTTIVPFPAAPPLEGALDLLDGEAGFAFDATTYDSITDAVYYGGPVGGTVAVTDSGTPANNLSNVALNASNLVQASTSPKLCVFPTAPVLRWSPHNICTRSEDFSHADWTTSANISSVTANDTTAPDGTVTADRHTATATSNDAYLRQATSQLNDQTYTFSVYAKQGNENQMWLRNAYTPAVAWFNLATGAVGTISGGTAGIADAGNGWYRCWITGTNTSETNNFVDIIVSDGDGSGGVTNGQYVYHWGAQVNRGPIPTPYVATTSTVPKVGIAQTYDAVAAQYGVWIEDAATNLALYSDDFTQTAWTKSNMMTAKTATGPDDGANSATTLTASAGNATALQAITSASAERVTSFWVKRRTGSGNIDLTQNNGSTWTTMTVTSSWTRVALATVTSANPTVGIRIVTSGDAIDVHGFQHELTFASSMTSTIPTVGITSTRSADNIDVQISTIPWDYDPFTFIMQHKTLTDYNTDPNNRSWLSHDATTDMKVETNSGGNNFWKWGGTDWDLRPAPITQNVVHKIAASTATNDARFLVNGGSPQSDAVSVTPSSDVTRIVFGASPNGTGVVNGYIYRFTYLPRAMTTVDMQAITT